MYFFDKGSAKNKLVEFAPKFAVDLIDLIRNGDEITSPSRRIDLGQICSISNHKS